jgi:hypothetical protein
MIGECASLRLQQYATSTPKLALIQVFRGAIMLNNISTHKQTRYAGSPSRRGRSNVPPLPEAVQEHLGRMLRADYFERGEKPRYLGDPGLPVEFDPYLYRLLQKERALRLTRIRDQGTKAVADALSGLAV